MNRQQLRMEYKLNMAMTFAIFLLPIILSWVVWLATFAAFSIHGWFTSVSFSTIYILYCCYPLPALLGALWHRYSTLKKKRYEKLHRPYPGEYVPRARYGSVPRVG